jgi:hypothetical protein
MTPKADCHLCNYMDVIFVPALPGRKGKSSILGV